MQRKEQWVALPGSAVAFVHSDWQRPLATAGLSNTTDFFDAIGEPLSKPGLGKRYRARLVASRESDDHILYLKRYQSERFGSRAKRWFEDASFNTPAHRDVQVASALAQHGISVPETVAWGYERSLGRRARSFVVSRAVPGDAIDRTLHQSPFLAKDLEAFQRKRRLVRELALLARKFHELGWCHRDFYLCHVFVHWVEATPRLSLIDLQRVFRPRWRVWRWRIKDLAQLNYSGQMFSRSMRLRFAKWYFGQDCLSASQKAVLRKVQRKTESIARHDQARRS